ncbi:MAG: UDP-2,3-diacylglucosamine diphosphatase LpxI [Nitrospirae bacterium]|nr:UDP-2,3-diacylglucosamine diphosphatase LpxI [Nitrospirota bacterium]
MSLKTIGLIAGTGELPRVLASEAREMGYRVAAIGLEPLCDPSLRSSVDSFYSVNVGKLGKIIEKLKKLEIKEAVMAGKVSKGLLYKSKLTPDWRAVKLLLSLKDRSDDSILLAITRELEREGIRLLSITTFTKNLLTPLGAITKRKPSKEEWKDIEFGWHIAKAIGKIDIGQTVVIKDRAVMAVEAIEGTDEAIHRGGNLAGGGATIIKVSKPKQDMRFDFPAAGPATLHAMKKVDAKVLALEAGNSIIIDKEKFIKEADRAGIAVVGINLEMQND